MLESMIAVAALEVPTRYQPRSARDEALRFARTCYDHLAGQMGVAIADVLIAREHVVLGDDGGMVTDMGFKFLTGLGLDFRVPSAPKRVFCRPCLDWSERRYHIAGRLGAALLCRCTELGWLSRARETRAVQLTATGHAGLRATFGLDLTEGEPLRSLSRRGGR